MGKTFNELEALLVDYAQLVGSPSRFASSLANASSTDNLLRIVRHLIFLTLYLVALSAALRGPEARSSVFEMGGFTILVFLSFALFYPAALLASRWFAKQPRALVLLVFTTAAMTLGNVIVLTPLALFLKTELYVFKVVTGIAGWLILLLLAIWFGRAFGSRRWQRIMGAVAYYVLSFATAVCLSTLTQHLRVGVDETTSREGGNPFFDPIGYEASELGVLLTGELDETAKDVLSRLQTAVDDVRDVLGVFTPPDSARSHIAGGDRVLGCEHWATDRDEWEARLHSRRDSIASRLSRSRYRRTRSLLYAQGETMSKTLYAVAAVDSMCANADGQFIADVQSALRTREVSRIAWDKLRAYADHLEADFEALVENWDSLLAANPEVRNAWDVLDAASPEKLRAALQDGEGAQELLDAVEVLSDIPEFDSAFREGQEAYRELYDALSAASEAAEPVIAAFETHDAAQDMVLGAQIALVDAHSVLNDERHGEIQYRSLLNRLAEWRLSYWF